MKVLVTGSHGYLGSACVELLSARGIECLRYDRATPDVPADIDAVVHCGGVTPHSPYTGGDERYERANVKGTETLLESINGHRRIRRFVNIGSAAEYGTPAAPVDEKTPERPRTAYGKSKLKQSRLVEAFANSSGVATFNLRVFNIAGTPRRFVGEGMHHGSRCIMEHLLHEFGRHARTITLSNENDERDFVDVRDIAEAVYAALRANNAKGYEVINICSGERTPLRRIAELVGSELNRAYTLKNKSSQAKSFVGIPRKAKRLLGWEAKIPLAESVRGVLSGRTRILIVGAGVAGEMVAQEMEKDERSDIIIAGYVDDDPKKQGVSVRGVRVVGTIADIPTVIASGRFDQILVSTPSVSGLISEVTKLVPAGFPIKVLPSISSVILGKVDLSFVRDIDPSDLIGRTLVKADQQLISKKAKGKTFLVTGGAGSIGSEIVRQLYSSGAKEIIVLDSWEEGIFNLLEELRTEPGNGMPKISTYIGNVRDKKRLEDVFRAHKIDVVLHAAAYKHVPLMEANPEEAKKTNEQGTKHVLDMVTKHKVGDFVLISTDKAVHPTSVMGKTKRAAELLVKSYARRYPKRRIIAVRFGNVLNSSGSLIPKFMRQIRNREPLTVTHRDMTRYFMSIPEAVSLVLSSWIVGKNGQILLLDMGEPVKIMDLAESLIRLHGLVPYEDISIIETGIRPGEKIHETLSYDPSNIKRSPATRVFVAEEL